MLSDVIDFIFEIPSLYRSHTFFGTILEVYPGSIQPLKVDTREIQKGKCVILSYADDLGNNGLTQYPHNASMAQRRGFCLILFQRFGLNFIICIFCSHLQHSAFESLPSTQALHTMSLAALQPICTFYNLTYCICKTKCSELFFPVLIILRVAE